MENGKKKYGNLPIGFVSGYENLNIRKAYFMLDDEVALPDNSGIEEISKNAYDEALLIIKQIFIEKQQDELNKMSLIIDEKAQERLYLWQTITELQLELLQVNQHLTDAQLVIEEIRGGGI